jgi:hypothetical protein
MVPHGQLVLIGLASKSTNTQSKMMTDLREKY